MASHEETSWSWTPSKFPMLRGVAFITNATTSRVYRFSLFRVSGVSVTRRRLICSITSAAIILSRSCFCGDMSRGLVSRIHSDPTGKPLGPRRGTPA